MMRDKIKPDFTDPALRNGGVWNLVVPEVRKRGVGVLRNGGVWNLVVPEVRKRGVVR